MTEPTRKPWRAAVIAAIVTFSVIAGTVGSWAYWSATGTATLGVGAATLSSSSAGWTATTLGNENVSIASSNTLTTTGTITFTNTTSTTSTSSQTLNVTFSRASGSSVLAGATTLSVWVSGGSCTTASIPASPTSGTWLAGVTVSTTLAPGASIVYCLRNTISDRQNADDATGTLTFTPQAAAELRAGTNFTNTTTTTSTISTQYIFPLTTITNANWYYVTRATTTWCWDVSGSGTTDGSLLISYACKNNTDLNQDWRFVDADSDGYGDIQARHAPNLRVAAAASTMSGTAVDMRTTAASSTQQWQAQLVAAGTYQYVNKYSGLCLSAPAVSTGVMTQVTCNGGADQKFTLTKRSAVPLTSIACTPTGSGSNRTGILTWAADYAAGPYTIKAVTPNGNTTSTLVPSQAATTYTIPAPIGSPFSGTTGDWTIQVTNSAGDVLGTEVFTVARQFTFSGYYYGTC